MFAAEFAAVKFGVSGLTLEGSTVISGWKNLKECFLVVDVDIKAVKSEPPVANRNYLAFVNESFLELKDVDLVPRVTAELKRNLNQLERIEVVARVINSRGIVKFWCPLVSVHLYLVEPNKH